MNDTPINLQALRDQHLLRIAWHDGEYDLPFVYLRRNCECAQCVNEWTGEPHPEALRAIQTALAATVPGLLEELSA